jgi:extradiol dioxygenase family protein
VLGVNTGDRQLGIFGQGATKGRALDHIGFEVQNLEAFTKQLEEMGIPFDLPYTAIPTLDLGIAFLTDPWGTYIELTEGLDEIQ